MARTDKVARRRRIKFRIRRNMQGTAQRPRLTVFRSNTALYAQLIDDEAGTTLLSANTRKFKEQRSLNIEDATKLGQEFAAQAADKGVTDVVFDRNGYKYHGKVKAFATAAREGGLKF